MSSARAAQAPYAEEQVNRWLSHLARGMQQRSQTIFLIEQLQPSWLQEGSQRWLYVLSSRVIECIFFMLLIVASTSFGLFAGARYDQTMVALSSELAGSLGPLMVGVLALGVFLGLGIGIVDGLGLRSGRRDRRWLRMLVRLCFFWLVFEWVLVFPERTPGAEQVVVGVIFAALFLFARARDENVNGDIRPVPSLSWSWRRAWVRGGRLSLLIALLCSPAWPLAPFARGQGLLFGIVCVVGGFGITAMLLWPAIGFFTGLQPGVVDLPAAPNERWRLSVRNGAVAAMSALFAVGLSYGLLFLVSYALDPNGGPPIAGFALGLSLGTLVAVTALLAYGHLDWLRHLTLRVILAQTGALPFALPRFLDYAVQELHFLERAGGGYLFIHRYLLEYFATFDLAPANPEEEPLVAEA